MNNPKSLTKVHFYPDKYVPALKPGSIIHLDNIEVKSGENVFSDEELERLQQHPDFIFWLRQGAFLVTNESIGDALALDRLPEPVPTPTPEPVPTPTPTPENMPNPEVETTQITVTPGLKVLVIPIGESTPQGGTITFTVTPGLKVMVLPVGEALTAPIPQPEITNEEIQVGTALGIKPEAKTSEVLARGYALPEVPLSPEVNLEVETSEVLAQGYALPEVPLSPEVNLEVDSNEAEETLPNLAPDAALPGVPKGIQSSAATKIFSTDVAKKYPKST